MIKNVYKYFFLLFFLITLSPRAISNDEEVHNVTVRMNMEESDPDMVFYDPLDDLADRQPKRNIEPNSSISQWVKNMFGPLYLALIIRFGQANDYVSKKINNLKHSLAL